MNELTPMVLFKYIFYNVAKAIGLFKWAQNLTKNEGRILCYHGGVIDDEHLFNPSLFITNKVFKEHLQLIQQYAFNVISLEEAVNRIIKKIPFDMNLVLTFDDGLYSTTRIIPLLKEYNYLATFYVTTYYVNHQSPIFNLILNYMFFKSRFKNFSIMLNGIEQQFKTKGKSRIFSIKTLFQHAQSLNEQQRNDLLEQISKHLEVDLDLICKKRLFHNVNPQELKKLHEEGVFDIQLHTHRHNLPLDRQEMTYELEKNKKQLSEITGKDYNKLCHLCYPSGIWKPEQFPLLKELNIKSATTLDQGFNNVKSELFALKRILCTNSKPLIIFEAELSGFHFLLKNTLHKLKNAIFFKKNSIQ